MIGEYRIETVKESIRKHKDPNLKKVLDANAKFKNKYYGERCFIFGNGPSLREVDFSLFKNEITFTVNQLTRNSNFAKLHTNFHMWSDYRFFDIDVNRIEDIDLLETMKAVNTDDNRPVVFYRYAARNMIEQNMLASILDIHYFEQGWYEIIPQKDIDFTRFTPAFSTVVHYLICLAVYMGFKEIYLLGCDCSSIITIANSYLQKAEQGLYGYSITENEKKRMERVQRQTSFRDELRSTIRLFDDYARIYEYCTMRGVKLYNATGKTLLDSVPKVELGDIL